MAKAILVMDMPDGCRHCRFSHDGWCESEDVYGKMCSLMDDWLIECFYTERADFCPLIPAIGYVEPVGNMISWEDDSDVD